MLTHKFDQPIIERIGHLYVLRDDLYPGGTKARILDKILHSIPQKEIVYAGHAFGYAGIALANACTKHSKNVTIFFPEMSQQPEPYKLTAKYSNVKIVTIETPENQMALHEHALEYAQKTTIAMLFLSALGHLSLKACLLSLLNLSTSNQKRFGR